MSANLNVTGPSPRRATTSRFAVRLAALQTDGCSVPMDASGDSAHDILNLNLKKSPTPHPS